MLLRPIHLLGPILAALPAFGQSNPVVTSVENAASNIGSPLPNSPIAQGALFVLKGAGLGPVILAADTTFPLDTSLAGTSVSITIGDTTTAAILVYTFGRQVAAILPSKTPTGTGTVTLTYNGRSSAPAPITVAATNAALYTLDGTGIGAAVATFQIPPGPNPVLLPANAANPGEVVILWATGLGATPSDETGPAIQADMPNVPIEAFVGGVPAEILFRGRNACCSSLDAIYIRIPAGVSGCVTPVTLKTAGIVSNTASLPIAASGRACAPTVPTLTRDEMQSLFAKPAASIGALSLIRGIDYTPGAIPRGDGFIGVFARYEGLGIPSVLRANVDIASWGACQVFPFAGRPGEPQPPTTAVPGRWLEAGPGIGVAGPSGFRVIPKSVVGPVIVYAAGLGDASPGNYLDPGGSYTLNADGFPGDIGPFTATAAIPAPFEWTNRDAIKSVDRAEGVTVRWSGGDPNGYVHVAGTSTATLSAERMGTATFNCTAPASAGSLTVPDFITRALPAGRNPDGSPAPGSMSVQGIARPVRIEAAGLDYAPLVVQTVITSPVLFQGAEGIR